MIPLMLVLGWRCGGCNTIQVAFTSGPTTWIALTANLVFVSHNTLIYVIINTPRGPMVFRHSAMCFGATASVWGFNPFADSMVFLFQHLFLGTTLHFVDDFGGIEPSNTAGSAFHSFGDFFSCLGLHMKTTRRLNPLIESNAFWVLSLKWSSRGSDCPHALARSGAQTMCGCGTKLPEAGGLQKNQFSGQTLCCLWCQGV